MEKHSVHLPWMWAPEDDGAGGKPVKNPDTIIITRGDDCDEEILRFSVGDLVDRWVQMFVSSDTKRIEGAVPVGLTVALAERFRELANTLENSLLRQPIQPSINLEDVSIFDLDLTVRTTNRLIKEQINNVAELLKYSVSDLRSFPDLGINAMREIVASVGPYGGLPEKSLVDIWSDAERAKRSKRN